MSKLIRCDRCGFTGANNKLYTDNIDNGINDGRRLVPQVLEMCISVSPAADDLQTWLEEGK